jgi:hypothetical protein
MQAGPGTLTGALAATSLWEYRHLALPVALPVRFFLFSRNLLTYPRLQRARCWGGRQFSVPIEYLDIPSDRAEALADTSPAKYEALRSAFSRRCN